MPLLEIKREPTPPRIVRMGHAPQPIESQPFDQPIPISQAEIDDAGPTDNHVERQLAKTIEPPIVEPKKPRGRPRMSQVKDADQVGTTTIRTDDAGEKGAIGSHGENALPQTTTEEGESDQGKEGE